MIKKPWQIWSLFGLILLIVLPAMVWLTMQINDADRLREEDRAETELARRKAELQERINSALYRLDSWTTPLVAQEVARPYYLYQPFIEVVGFNSFIRAPALPTAQLPNAAPQIPNGSDEQAETQQRQTQRQRRPRLKRSRNLAATLTPNAPRHYCSGRPSTSSCTFKSPPTIK